jgi:hypothetical protein
MIPREETRSRKSTNLKENLFGESPMDQPPCTLNARHSRRDDDGEDESMRAGG